jgi:hypothetical protein
MEGYRVQFGKPSLQILPVYEFETGWPDEYESQASLSHHEIVFAGGRTNALDGLTPIGARPPQLAAGLLQFSCRPRTARSNIGVARLKLGCAVLIA